MTSNRYVECRNLTLRKATLRRTSGTARRAYASGMELYCADCGCLVERGIRVAPCKTVECCCLDLPIQPRTVAQIADRIEAAFATKDLDLLGRVLAEDARWGDDDSPDKCRSRSDVIGTFDQLLAGGVDGTVTETIVGDNGVVVLLHVEWPDPGDGRDVDLFQAYLIQDGAVTEIQPHDDQLSAVRAIST